MTYPSLQPNTAMHQLPDGGKMRYVICEPEGNACGTIVIAPGRREFIEKKYQEIGEDFLKRGYRVIIFEWRDQGLSDRTLTGDQRQRNYTLDFQTHLDDFQSLYKDVVKPYEATGPVFGCGHSMGGHLLLRGVAGNHEMRIAGLLLTAPMIALAPRWVETLSMAICKLQIKRGRGKHYVTGQHDYDESDRTFIGNPLTRDPERFRIIQRYFLAYSEMIVGGVTWEWLYAALKSMRIARQQKIDIPTLIVAGGKDLVVYLAALKAYAKQRKGQTKLVIMPKALHDITNEIESCRSEVLQHIFAFLKRPETRRSEVQPHAFPTPA